MQNSELIFYQLHSFNCGPEISRSITVKENFSWSVYYRRQPVNPEYCIILKNVPPMIKSGILSDWSYCAYISICTLYSGKTTSIDTNSKW